MPLSPNEAAGALRDLSQTEKRSARAYSYRLSAPHFFLWGTIWVIEYGAFYFDQRFGPLFSILSMVGLAGSFWISWRSRAGRANDFSWRYGTTALTVAAFVTALFAIFRPTSNAQVGAFFPLLVALSYILMGIWMSALRMAALGAIVGALTLVGYFCLPGIFMIWMAVVGGASLILGGVWLRSV